MRMDRRSVVLFMLLAIAPAWADESQAELAKKPPYERMLKGDDLKKAEELETKNDELEAAGKREQAGKVAEELLALRKKLQGNDHWEVADAKRRLADQKQLRSQEQSQQLLDARSQNQKGEELERKGKYAKAEPLFQKALAIRRKVLGEEHPSTATSYNNVASNLDDQGKSAEAEPLYQKALAIRRKVLGEEHPDTAASYNIVALILKAQGKSSEAEPLYQKALAIRRKVLGEEHPNTARCGPHTRGDEPRLSAPPALIAAWSPHTWG